MAFNNRDYSQDGYEGDPGPAWAQSIPATKWLLIVTVATFILEAMLAIRSETGAVWLVEEWCLLDAARATHGQIWRFVTYAFCHPYTLPLNFAFLMLILWTLGTRLEGMYGSRELVLIYLTSALVSGLVFATFSFYIPLPRALVGSTPCIAALFTLYAVHFPREQIQLAFILPVQVQVLYWIYIACELYWVLKAQTAGSPWSVIPYLSVIWGALFAYAYYRFQWRLDGFLGALDPQSLRRRLRKFSTSRSLRVVRPDVGNDLDAQVDTILAKIHEKGSESLTERERAILQRASERAKNRG